MEYTKSQQVESNGLQELKHRLESLQQENIVLKSEVDTYKLKVRALQEENLQLRKNSVNIQVRAEQEEEYISNKLLKKITELKKEKETLALNYEQEEEFLTNDLIRKLNQLRDEKANLEDTLEKEQKAQISKLTNRIQKLENDVKTKQKNLDTLRHEKIELENALEQEQEGLVNRLWKKMEKLESEKKLLQSKLDVSVSSEKIASEKLNDQLKDSNEKMEIPEDSQQNKMSQDTNQNTIFLPISSSNVALNDSNHSEPTQSYIERLREEVYHLRSLLSHKSDDYQIRMRGMSGEERSLHEENRRLRRQLQAEIERRQDICRNLSESESSLEIDEERQFNERRKGNNQIVSTFTENPQPLCSSVNSNSSINNSTTLFPNNNRIRTTSDSSGLQGSTSNIDSIITNVSQNINQNCGPILQSSLPPPNTFSISANRKQTSTSIQLSNLSK